MRSEKNKRFREFIDEEKEIKNPKKAYKREKLSLQDLLNQEDEEEIENRFGS